ncbi:MBL fold metallo-hydrolase [Shinella daejeonensis]|uniref:MBL fold metallo-hydrolase n=1 Tax=Shinella daejeonensis TaxID=659017 RepID=UPI0020C7ADDF|nr:MBL fold metallo-hydrolase [Shinella daejeonensis]MCP8894801.1 MBL fold metallo-hydrolase [Shinella daejeonensis]
MTTLSPASFPETLAERLAMPPAGDIRLYWLGQAGFAIVGDGYRIVIDPYLSDSLAEKYRGKHFEHERMMPAPIRPADLGPVDLVLVTHQHTDHMDPETLGPLATASPACRFLVPRAAIEAAGTRIGVGDERLIAIDAGEQVEPLPGLRITAVRAAHETLERTAEGWHRFLGYVIETGGVRIYHSGDTIPFEGLAEEIAPLAIDLALLPVNGRSDELLKAGIAGNLTLEEACRLAERIGAGDMIAHHYGMFAFNTADPAAIDAKSAAADCGAQVHRAKLSVEYRLSR